MEQFQELRESVNPLCQFEETTKKANKRLFYQRENLEFKLFISFSNSYLVIGLIKKLFLQLLVRYLSKAVSEFGSFFARLGPIFTK